MEAIKGKYVLLAGATGGIGAATARIFASAGAHLFLTGRNKEKLKLIAAEIGISEQAFMAADIAAEDQVSGLQTAFFSCYPKIDILINAAGLGIIKPLELLTADDMIRSLQANLLGSFNLVRTFLPHMKTEKRGLVINIPGVLGKTPMAGAAAYSASKYALVGMMQSIREEIKRTEIRITNIYMGGVDTPFWDSIDLRVQREKMIRADEAARAIWFLAQQPASAVVSEMVLQPFNHQAI